MSATGQAATVAGLSAPKCGSVVLSGKKVYGSRATWIKYDDTELLDEDGHRMSAAWASPEYTTDRTSEQLDVQFGPMVVLWDASDGEVSA